MNLEENMMPQQPQTNESKIKPKSELELDIGAADTNYTTYHSILNSTGKCCGYGKIFCPCIFCCVENPYQQVDQSYEGLLERYGRYVSSIGPGLHYINPMTEKITKVDMKIQIIDLNRQVVITKDNITLMIDASVNYRVLDAKKAEYKLRSRDNVVTFLTYATLRNVCGHYILQDLLEKRQEVTQTIQEMVEEHVDEWGLRVEQIFIKDIILNPELQESLSAAAKERRLAEGKIISAKADVESAKLMRESADLLNSKAAMQIRFLETMGQLSKTPNTKIIFIPNKTDGHKVTQGMIS